VKIPIAKPDIGKDETQAVVETMKSGWVSQGEKVEGLEESFAKYCGVKYGVAVSSGTAALHIALTALDIKRGKMKQASFLSILLLCRSFCPLSLSRICRPCCRRLCRYLHSIDPNLCRTAKTGRFQKL
jgi:hypothetical protein